MFYFRSLEFINRSYPYMHLINSPSVSLLFLVFVLSACQEKSTKNNNDESNRPPNIILIIGDDQGYPYFGFMGADYVYTPNMDALAASGYLFTQGYVPDNHCRPSLQTLLTSTLPIDYKKQVDSLLAEDGKTRLFENAESKNKWEKNFRHKAMSYFETLPKKLAKNNYRSFQGGKWWEYDYTIGGFDRGMTTGWTDASEKDGANWFKEFMGGDGLKLARATMEPVYQFIDSAGQNPFFIWFAPELPHYPFNAPDKYYNLYKDKKMSESAKRYYANCTWFDDGVGALVNYLNEKNLIENTMLIYVNDNGWEQRPDQEFRSDSMRWHNGGDKGKLSLYDQSFRTPIIFNWPGQIEPGINERDLIHSADIPATILDYVRIERPANYFGKSYRAVMENGAAAPRDQIIGNITQTRSEADMMGRRVEGYWIRTPDWFFNWSVTDDEKNLFDMRTDPNNDHNVIERQPAVAKKLQDEIDSWKKMHY